MEKTFIGVRDVDAEVFRKFRAIAVRNKIKLGLALTKAMKNTLEKEKKEGNSKGIQTFIRFKPISFGKENKDLSKEIDKILYGKK